MCFQVYGGLPLEYSESLKMYFGQQFRVHKQSKDIKNKMKAIIVNKERKKMESARTYTLLKGNQKIKEIKVING